MLLRYPEQLQGTSRKFNAQLETASYQKMKDWRTLLIQHLLQQNKSVTGEDKIATGIGERKQHCGMPLLTDLAVMMRIDPLALVFGLREFVTVVYGRVMSRNFPDVQVKPYRNSVLYVNLVSVVDYSVLDWVEQKELKGLASDDRFFGKIAEPEWILMDFNIKFKCRMGGEDFLMSSLTLTLGICDQWRRIQEKRCGSRLGRNCMHTSRIISKCGFPGLDHYRTNVPDIRR